MSFAAVMSWIRSAEGGYWVDPRVGPVYCGISQGYFSAWLMSQGAVPMSVQLLADRPELVDAYYMAQYWLPIRGYDLLPSTAPALAVFDGGVLQGVNTMVKIFQSVVGVLPDGHFGPLTLSRYKQSITSLGAQNLATQLIARRREMLIALNDPAMQQGWLNRLVNLQLTCDTFSN